MPALFFQFLPVILFIGHADAEWMLSIWAGPELKQRIALFGFT